MHADLSRLLPRRLHAAALCVSLAALVAPAAAQTPKFDRFAFERAVAGRAPVVVHFYAPWCAACQLQKPIVAQLLQEPGLRPINFFVADHDRERLLRSLLAVPQPGTFVVFRNGHEAARSTGEISRHELRATFLRAVRDADPTDASGAGAPRAAGRGRGGGSAGADEPPLSPAAQTPFTPYSINPPPPVKRP